ncbi:MAG TPA: AAC(3) family N-acetyltransferase [Clostridiales bacterium]|nr:AAC(3) family N-acetyltransferase [Clostridiales bacterium]
MYTKQALITNLRNMGIQENDTLLIHSSMKSIGDVDGGAETVLDSFMEYLSDGLLLLPTHTWANMNETHNIFDPEKEPSCVGLLTNLFMKREGVVRSLHPTHSMAAYGKDNKEFIKGEENITTPCSPGGCYDRLRTRNGKILLLGVNHIRNTYLHFVEEALNVPDRLTEKPTLFHIVMPDKTMKENHMYRHFNKAKGPISDRYSKLEQAFFDTNVAKEVYFGDARCILCDANGLYDVMEHILSQQINCIMELDTIPETWWETMPKIS